MSRFLFYYIIIRPLFNLIALSADHKILFMQIFILVVLTLFYFYISKYVPFFIDLEIKLFNTKAFQNLILFGGNIKFRDQIYNSKLASCITAFLTYIIVAVIVISPGVVDLFKYNYLLYLIDECSFIGLTTTTLSHIFVNLCAYLIIGFYILYNFYLVPIFSNNIADIPWDITEYLNKALQSSLKIHFSSILLESTSSTKIKLSNVWRKSSSDIRLLYNWSRLFKSSQHPFKILISVLCIYIVYINIS